MQIVQKTEMSIIMGTHNYELAEKMSRKFLLSEGRLLER
jgi:ABC-type lipoprotein export system ATPase subunit